MTPQLTVIHLVRKPLAGTVASNALKYGTGGLNIDACRIGTEDNLGGGAYAENPTPRPNPEEWRFKRGGAKPKSLLRTQNRQDNGGSMNPGVWQGGTTGSVNGRWPANLILQHEPGCQKVGEHFEEFNILNYTDSTSGNFSFFTENQEERPEVEETVTGQMVEDWQCVEGCPCLDLDRQSGRTTSGPNLPVDATNWKSKPFDTAKGWNAHSMHGHGQQAPQGYADEGGASRYFKQVQSEQELRDYLKILISPPPTPTSPHAQIWGPEWPWAGADNPGSQVGLLIHGFVPTEEQVAVLYQALVPGGHLCLVAPDDQPTGHTGVIRLEDAGFEVRDAILWVRGPGRVHYVAKAARKEREAGCSKLPSKDTTGTVERELNSAGAQNPRAGAGRGAGAPRFKCHACGLHLGGGRSVSVCPKTSDGQHVPYEYERGAKVHNFHPTVKPIALMAKLLSDVPKDQGPVIDPFVGSGTTMVACLQTGHDGIGIERDPEYMGIAEARVKYGNRWTGATIQRSDKTEEPNVQQPDLLDMFE